MSDLGISSSVGDVNNVVVSYALDDFAPPQNSQNKSSGTDSFFTGSVTGHSAPAEKISPPSDSEKPSLWERAKSGWQKVRTDVTNLFSGDDKSQTAVTEILPQKPEPKHLFTTGSVTVNLDRVWKDKIGKPVEHTSVAHCDRFVDYMLSPSAVQEKIIDKQPDEISKTAAKSLLVPSKFMYGMDWFYYHVFGGVGKVDEVINQNGLFAAAEMATRLARPEPEQNASSTADHTEEKTEKSKLATAAEFAAKWGVRSAEVYGAGWGLSYAVNRLRNTQVGKILAGLSLKKNADELEVLRELQKGADPKKNLPLGQGWLLKTEKDIEHAYLKAGTPQNFNDLSPQQRRYLVTRGQNAFWLRKGGWALGGSILMAASGLVKNISSDGVNFFIPEKTQKNWSPATRQKVQTTFDLGLIGAGAVMLGESYRKVYSHLDGVTPKNYGRGIGYLFGGGYLAQSWWAYNVAAQQRILPQKDSNTSPNAAYNPLNWDWSRAQLHTTTSSAVGIFLTSPIWAALSPLSLKLADGLKFITGADKSVMKFTEAEKQYLAQTKNFTFRGHDLGFGKTLKNIPKGLRLAFGTLEPVKLTARDHEYIRTGLKPFVASKRAWLDCWIRQPLYSAKNKVLSSDAARKFLTSRPMVSLRKKLLSDTKNLGWLRRKFATASIVASYPLGLAIGRASRMAQGYTDKKSLTGGSMQTVFTYPAFTASQQVSLAVRGQVTNIDAFVAGMFVINNNFSLCTWADEGVYQSTIAMANDYNEATDPVEKANLAAELLNNYLISYGDVDFGVIQRNEEGAEDMMRTEKYKIWVILSDLFGVDPEELLAKAAIGVTQL